MAATLFSGQHTWSATRDEDGHREYTISHRVQAAVTDGPNVVMFTPGLPAVGSSWNFDGDSDPWAFCLPTMRVTAEAKGEKNTIWMVEQKFTTKPGKRCRDTTIEDPLLEPPDIKGGTIKFTREVAEDRNGAAIKNSSHEMIQGPKVEFDDNRPTVTISFNVAALDLAFVTPFIDTVNDGLLWGMPVRTIKLSDFTWERKLWGICNFYYTLTFIFEANFNTFDRFIADVGTKALKGTWSETGWVVADINGSPASASNPQHFDVVKDRNDEVMKQVLLDGAGKPSSSGTPVGIPTSPVEFYPESNFLLLGIPISL